MNLKTYLWKYKLTQAQFSERSGVKRTSIGSYVRNYRQPNASTAMKIFKATDGEVSFEELFSPEFAVDLSDYRKYNKTSSDNMSICI